MNPDPDAKEGEGVYGVMTSVLDEMLKEKGINIPYLEAPVKESIDSEKSIRFFNQLYDLFNVPKEYRHLEKFLEKK